MGLAGTVVQTAGKAAVSGTKTLTNGVASVVNNRLSSVGNALTGSSNRGQQAESKFGDVLKNMDTTGKTSDGYDY